LSLVLLVVSASASVVASATPGASTRFRIYDPTGESKVQVTIADVVRSSARATRGPGGIGILSFGLTRRGGIRFHRLTLVAARRGARLHRPQRIAIQIGGSISKPLIDYFAFPDGLDAGTAVVINVPRFSMAQRFAREIRQG
jgi:hypothetical protein